MKKMLNDLKKGLTIGFGIMLMVGIIGGAYASLASLKVNTGNTLSAQLWNDLVDHSVPSGFVGAFNLATCPTGWTVADGTNDTPDLRGAFVRGMNGSVNGRDVVRTLGEYQSDAFQGHGHKYNYRYVVWIGNSGTQVTDAIAYEDATSASSNIRVKEPISDGTNGTPRTSIETRPKNVALLYCVKN